MSRISTVLPILFLAAPALHAQESPADLLKKLGSGSYPEREKAGKLLEKLGPAALPTLLKSIDHADLETRRRVLLIMDRIEDQLAVESVLKATPIALRFKDEPIESAMGKVRERMNLLLGARPAGDFQVTLDTGSLPYWQAWKNFRSAAKLEELEWANHAGKLRRIEGDAVDIEFSKRDAEQDTLLNRLLAYHPPAIAFASERTAYAEDDRSSVRVRLKWIELKKASADAGPMAVFAIEVRPEPRLQLAAVPRVEITKIVDADSKEQTPKAIEWFAPQSDPRDALTLAVACGEIQWGGLLHFKAIRWAGPARPLKELHGRIHLEASWHGASLEMPGLGKAEGKEFRGPDGVTVKVLETDVSDDGKIHLRLRFNHLDSLTPHTDKEKYTRTEGGVIAVRGAMDVALERLRLRDGRGWLHRSAGAVYKETQKGCYEASVHYAAVPGRFDDFGLVLTKAARTVKLEMPFQVSDVPAP